MLFNSYVFLFGYLPLVLVGTAIAGSINRRTMIWWLAVASLVFYAYWHPPLVFLLLGSIAVNYIAALMIVRSRPGTGVSRAWMWGAIAIDLGALGFFKYLFSALNALTAVTASGRHWPSVVLPLGISFFTFTQIAYLVDLQEGVASVSDVPSYILFVTFFPHLIAGPVLHHKEMMPQFLGRRRGYSADHAGMSGKFRLNASDLGVGFSWFLLGLGKKVLLADNFADTANAVFALHGPLPAVLAWRGAISYALQLYFDFSGYSDMALGLARMLSIDLPLNFNSPYKAANIVEFWERWHMTLSRYILEYLYAPLQRAVSSWRQERGLKVSRKAQATPSGFASMVAGPTLLTMLIAGVWHGAGLQYLVFGLLHGVYISVYHGWRLLVRRPAAQAVALPAWRGRLGHGAAVLVTFLCAVVSVVYFRASGVVQGSSITAGMLGLHGLGLHTALPFDNRSRVLADLLEIAAGLAIVWGLPNTQQILTRFAPSLDETVWNKDAGRWWQWRPDVRWAMMLGAVLFAAVVWLQNPSTFLYFQF